MTGQTPQMNNFCLVKWHIWESPNKRTSRQPSTGWAASAMTNSQRLFVPVARRLVSMALFACAIALARDTIGHD